MYSSMRNKSSLLLCAVVMWFAAPGLEVPVVMSAMTLVQLARAGDGKDIPKERQQRDVTVLDVFGNAASAKIIASDWIDYLHLAKWRGRWVIVNVLWELKPKEETKSTN
jgi:hypothetical protein